MPISESAPRILIIHADPTSTRELESALDDEGYVIRHAGADDVARKRLGHSPDAILLDAALLRPDGRDVFQRIRMQSHLRTAPVIIVAGDEEHEGVIRGLERGAQETLSMPFHRDIVRARVRSVISARRAVDQLHSMFRDVESTRHQAGAADTARSRFLAGMSDEMRTPMSGVMSMTDLLLDTDLDQEQQDYVDTIQQSASALLTVFDEILDFSRASSGRLKIEPVSTDLHEIVDEVFETVAMRAEEKGLQLDRLYISTATSHVRADRRRLRQVLVHLVDNAIKFTEQGSVLMRIDSRADDSGRIVYTFSVEDTGIGIPEHRIGDLFRTFGQADSSSTRRQGGAGLGLALCNRIVEAMGGTMEAESAAGVGSVFHVSVPLDAALDSDAIGGTLTSKRPTPSRSATRVLVVENNLVHQVTAMRLLEAAGCTVGIATNGFEAIELHERDRYDLILLDCLMPGMSGHDTAAAIRDRETNDRPPVPIVGVLDNPFGEDGGSCRDAGMNDILRKPFEEREFTQILERWLD